MVHSKKSLFTEEKWYLVSPVASGQWSSVVAGWVASGATAASNASFYRYIYKQHIHLIEISLLLLLYIHIKLIFEMEFFLFDCFLG